MKQLEEKEQSFMIGSLPCFYFSSVQDLNKHNLRHDEERMVTFNDNLIKAIEHIKFCVSIYWKQKNAGRYWLHEHSWGTKS